ncbi:MULTISPECIES: hypothetical protein [Sphingobacterium]|uniref:hypothetical protein n=1 Tax=Sphingobacterium TaxID=28453 RepID=UPI00257EC1BC|nr:MULTISPECIES: hypothetical protein [Sphingobacterium]
MSNINQIIKMNMKKKTEKAIYVTPVIERLQVMMEEGVAAGSAGSAQPGGGSGVSETDWNNGGSETQDPSSCEWWN